MGTRGPTRLLPLLLTPQRGLPPPYITYFSTSVCTQPFQEAICRARSAIAKASWKGREKTAQSGDPQTHPKVRIGAPQHAQPLQKGATPVVSAPHALLLPNLATGSPHISQILLVGCFWRSRAGSVAPLEEPHGVVRGREQNLPPSPCCHTPLPPDSPARENYFRHWKAGGAPQAPFLSSFANATSLTEVFAVGEK